MTVAPYFLSDLPCLLVTDCRALCHRWPVFLVTDYRALVPPSFVCPTYLLCSRWPVVARSYTILQALLPHFVIYEG